MKYLSDYKEEAKKEIFKKFGAFFAFSNKQFNEQKKPNVKYVLCFSGLIVPKNNIKQFFVEWDNVIKEAIKQDIAENGIEKIIEREIFNYECFVTMDITEPIRVLKAYGVTPEQVQNVYNKIVVNEKNYC